MSEWRGELNDFLLKIEHWIALDANSVAPLLKTCRHHQCIPIQLAYYPLRLHDLAAEHTHHLDFGKIDKTQYWTASMFSGLLKDISELRSSIDPRAPKHYHKLGLPLIRRDSPLYRLSLRHICDNRPIHSFLEVGVRRGEALDIVLKHSPHLLNVTLCDLWSLNDRQRLNRKVVEELLSIYPQSIRTTFVDGSTTSTLSTITDTFDLIGIDGSHRRDVFRRDLHNAWPLLAPNGILVADDIVLHDDHRLYAEINDFVASTTDAAWLFVDLADWPGVAIIGKTTANDQRRLQAALRRIAAHPTSVSENFDALRKLVSSPSDTRAVILSQIELQDWEALDAFILFLASHRSLCDFDVLFELLSFGHPEIGNSVLAEILSKWGDPSIARRLDRLNWRDIPDDPNWVPGQDSKIGAAIQKNRADKP